MFGRLGWDAFRMATIAFLYRTQAMQKLAFSFASVNLCWGMWENTTSLAAPIVFHSGGEKKKVLSCHVKDSENWETTMSLHTCAMLLHLGILQESQGVAAGDERCPRPRASVQHPAGCAVPTCEEQELKEKPLQTSKS